MKNNFKKWLLFLFLTILFQSCLKYEFDNPAEHQIAVVAPTLIFPLGGETNIAIRPTFSWSPVPGSTGYTLQVSADNTFSALHQNILNIASAGYSIPQNSAGLVQQTQYWWRVRASNNNSISDWSVVRSFTTVSNVPNIPALSLPYNGATGQSLTPTLNWNASSDATGYSVQVSTNGSFSNMVFEQSGISNTNIQVSGLTSSATYYWRVSAVNNSGNSGWSTIWSFTTGAGGLAPTAPTLLSPGNGSTGQSNTPTLSWNAATGATGYNLQVSTNSSFTSLIINQNVGNITSKQISGLSNSTLYYWHVNASNNYGSSAYSNYWYFTTAAQYTINITALNGTVTKNPDQTSYAAGTNVTLTAKSNSGYAFTGWSGDANGTTNPLTIAINSNKNITANFTLISTTQYTLNITALNGTVTKNPDQTSYASGTTVTLTAIPNAAYVFSNWSGDVSGTSNPMAVTVNGNKNITAIFYPGTTGACQGVATVTYSGKTYNTVAIGNQCWLKENLDVGTMIQGSLEQANNAIIEKYCYNNDANNCNTYGGLYQWAEAVQYKNGTTNTSSPSPAFSGNVQGICPSGWHIPTYSEWNILVGSNDGNALKAIGQGTGSGAGTNTSGFSGLLSGSYGLLYRNFGYLTYSFIISSTENAITSEWVLQFGDDSSGIVFGGYQKSYGFSVRCLKD